jgi:hypothetical protein
VIESLGSYVEYYVIDRLHPNFDQMMEKWRLFLRIAWKDEPTGQHYLRRMLAVFKFELNMCVAMLLVLASAIPLACSNVVSSKTALWVAVSSAIAGGYLFHAATQTSKVLAEIRELLLQGVGQPPFSPASGSSSTQSLRENHAEVGVQP